MVDGAVEKKTVVAHDYHAAAELCDVVFQNAESRDVEVVGRLVEDEEVGGAHEHGGKIQPPLLASAELVDVVLLGFGAEQKQLQKLRCGVARFFIDYHHFGYASYGVDYFVLLVELYAVLAVVAEFHRLADVEMSGVGSHLAEEHFL